MKNTQNRIIKILNLLIGGLLSLSIFSIVWLATYPLRLESRINIGSTIPEAIKAIGSSPDREDSIPIYCYDGSAYQGTEICSPSKKPCAVKYLQWKAGIDTWLVLGVNKENKICTKGIGET